MAVGQRTGQVASPIHPSPLGCCGHPGLLEARRKCCLRLTSCLCPLFVCLVVCLYWRCAWLLLRLCGLLLQVADLLEARPELALGQMGNEVAADLLQAGTGVEVDEAEVGY